MPFLPQLLASRKRLFWLGDEGRLRESNEACTRGLAPGRVGLRRLVFPAVEEE